MKLLQMKIKGCRRCPFYHYNEGTRDEYGYHECMHEETPLYEIVNEEGIGSTSQKHKTEARKRIATALATTPKWCPLPDIKK